MGQDEETISDLQNAVKDSTLRKAYDLCLSGVDEDGVSRINVATFVNLCRDKAKWYIESLDEEQEGEGEEEGRVAQQPLSPLIKDVILLNNILHYTILFIFYTCKPYRFLFFILFLNFFFQITKQIK